MKFGNSFAQSDWVDMTNETLIQEYNRTHPDESHRYNKKKAIRFYKIKI